MIPLLYRLSYTAFLDCDFMAVLNGPVNITYIEPARILVPRAYAAKGMDLLEDPEIQPPPRTRLPSYRTAA